MKKKLKEIMYLMKTVFSFLLLFVFLLMLVVACASPGTPNGGDYDVTPPKFLGSNPAPNTTNFTGNKIELFFDEYIVLEKPNEIVITTPPQMQAPIIKGVGRKISVELKDSLINDVTYTFDFTNGITDNNERNVLEGFTFAFSTGEIIDSLVVSGMLLNAENLEPMPGIMVGLHKNPEDSAFTTIPFNRTSKTNEIGQFWIRNIAPGEYHLFALEDINRDYKYNFPTEGIAFEDSLIIPSFVPDIRMDTVWVDSLTIDTIHTIHYNRFIPDDVVLYYFTDNFTPQYFSKSERVSDRQFILHFGADIDIPPSLYLLQDSNSQKEYLDPWFMPEYAPDNKSITYWITDSALYQQDTLQIELDYMAHDSLRNLVAHTDTISLNLRRRSASDKKKEGELKIELLDIKLDPTNTIDVFDTVKITLGEPLWGLDITKLKFQQKIDTLWEDCSFPILQDTLNPRLYYIQNQWDFGQEFQLTIDSAEIFSIYDKWNDSIYFKWKVRALEEYGDLYVKIVGNEFSGFGQLLDASERVVRSSFLFDNELIFENLKPGKYYLRYIDDRNENGKWDPGNYEEKRQPEKVYYFESLFEIGKLVSFDHTWNIKTIPRTKQKPLEIIKNKPKEKKPNRNEQRNQQNKNQQSTNQRSSNQQGSGFGSLPMSPGGSGRNRNLLP